MHISRYEQTVEEDFHISKACIEPNPNNGKICSVYLEQDNEEFILCNLSQKNLNESLDLNFSESEKICFRVEVRSIYKQGLSWPKINPIIRIINFSFHNAKNNVFLPYFRVVELFI